MMEQSCQPNLFGYEEVGTDYPDIPGHRGVDTSAEAAEEMASRLGRLQQLALSSITNAGAIGLTTNELADMLELPREAIQPRTSELRRKGLIVDSCMRRFNANGKRAIVWTAPEHRRRSSATLASAGATIEAKHG